MPKEGNGTVWPSRARKAACQAATSPALCSEGQAEAAESWSDSELSRGEAAELWRVDEGGAAL